jgi:hypothetical protein
MSKCNLDDQKTEFLQLKTLGLFWIITTILVVILIYISTWFFPEEDMFAALRVIHMRLAPVLLFNMVLMTTIVIWDFITPGNTIECINSDPKSAAIFYSVFIASIAYMVGFLV